MNLIALTTSTSHWSVWLHRRDGWQRAVHAEAGRGTGQRASLTRMVWQLLAEADLQPADLQRVVCDIGPGSFTGLRQGLALARALAWANAIPTHGVGSLQSMAWAVQSQLAAGQTCAVALPARADVDFIGLGNGAAFTERALTQPDALAWWQEFRPDVLAIPAADLGRSLAKMALTQGAQWLELHPEAEAMGRWSLAQPAATSTLAPRYLAVSEAEHHAGVAIPEIMVAAIDRSGGGAI